MQRAGKSRGRLDPSALHPRLPLGLDSPQTFPLDHVPLRFGITGELPFDTLKVMTEAGARQMRQLLASFLQAVHILHVAKLLISPAAFKARQQSAFDRCRMFRSPFCGAFEGSRLKRFRAKMCQSGSQLPFDSPAPPFGQIGWQHTLKVW